MRLLVSVRSADEAELAVAGGADLIDVKEPSRGPLGRADDATVLAVVRAVAGRRPVSAALGELLDASLPPPAPLRFRKWGLAGCGARPDWRERLKAVSDSGRESVAAAYADWRRAGAPSPDAVCAFACDNGWGAFLLDTWGKDGSTLLDWLSLPEIERLCGRCRAAGVPVALAGSLGPEHVEALFPLRPDWFAVRGAVCEGGRGGALHPDRVRRLAGLLAVTPAD